MKTTTRFPFWVRNCRASLLRLSHRTLVIGSLLMLSAINAALIYGADDVSQWYPKSQSEIKAILAVLEPSRDASDKTKEIYIQRLKTYRYICDVPFDDLSWDNEYANLAHHASAICSKLNKLTHTPEKPSGMSDEEYALGKRGAGQSNLFMGRTEPGSCVDGWMDDSDKSNIDRVGHRRWILNPKMLTSGFGSVGKFAAMYAFDGSRKNIPDWDYVAYPTRGYMPNTLFGGHYAWSVSINKGKYATPKKEEIKASIQPLDKSLTPAGEPLELNYFNVENGGFGSGPAIIFRPKSVSLSHDTRYKVVIKGVKKKDGSAAQIEYVVHFVDIKKAPDTAEGKRIIAEFLRKRLDAVKAMTDRFEQLNALVAFIDQDLAQAATPELVKEAKTDANELMKDPELKKEMKAAEKYAQVADLERKAGDNKKSLANVAITYRELAKVYKGTRSAAIAEADYERLKSHVE